MRKKIFSDLIQAFKKTAQLKIISFLLFLFIFYPSLHAFQVPAQFGRVRQENQGTNGKTLVLIEEAHAAYEVQKNILEILKLLVLHQGTRLILVEGGWGNVSLSYLRNYGSPEGRLKVAQDYLQSGKIAAEEYLDITSDLEIELWGVEDPALYEQNMKAFFAIQSEQAKWLAELSKLKSAFDAQAEKVFPQTLQEFRKKQEAFGGPKISLLEYLQFLVKAQTGPETLNKFPTLRNLMALSGEGGFDPEKVEWEKHELVRALSRRMTKPELEELALHENRKTSEEELAFIQVLLAAYQREASAAKRVKVDHLRQYVRSLEESLKMDSRKLFSELRALEDQTADRLAQTTEQKELVKKLAGAALLGKLFKLELGPEDFARLRQDPVVIPAQAGIQVDLLQNALRQAQEFYIAAEAREKAMIRNVTEKMDTQKEKDAVLISGGFHTERLSRAFQELGFSVVVLTPRFASTFDSKGHQERYFQILKEKWGEESHPVAPISNLQSKSQGGVTQNAIQ